VTNNTFFVCFCVVAPTRLLVRPSRERLLISVSSFECADIVKAMNDTGSFSSQYSLEGHQFAVFGICLTSDARYVVSVSNKFLIWDLSTSDLTRAVSPGIEGVFQGLVLSPDDRFTAAWTNNSQVSKSFQLSSFAAIRNFPFSNFSSNATDC